MVNAALEIARLEDREKKLIEITAMLSSVCDLSTLLEKIVESLRAATHSDAGSLYIVENEDTLLFSVAQNDSKEIPFKAFKLPISPKNIAGYVAQSGTLIRFEDVYQIDESHPFRFNADFDRTFGYRTKSMVAVPMRNRQGRIVGVVQLINRKKDFATRLDSPDDVERSTEPYSDEDVEFLEILASQAAIAIERQSLYEGIERLLRGFVESSAKSIESRDKVTGGHSQRIAAYMVVLAKRMTRAEEGPLKDVAFSPEQVRELLIAAMLHDIGKIGVREHVLNKQNKLTDDRMETIRLRIEIAALCEPETRASWEEAWTFLKEVNIPGFLDDDRHTRLQEVAKREAPDGRGGRRPLLDEFELENLAVRRGNLTDAERKMIESHVFHSEKILSAIPWTENLRQVPLIAGTHHEKMNGKGYPKGLAGEEIPIGGRMLAVVDVFEALTAQDRPYKRAMPVERALEILRSDAKAGALDTAIVEFFIGNRCYEVVTDEMRKGFALSAEEILALS